MGSGFGEDLNVIALQGLALTDAQIRTFREVAGAHSYALWRSDPQPAQGPPLRWAGIAVKLSHRCAPIADVDPHRAIFVNLWVGGLRRSGADAPVPVLLGSGYYDIAGAVAQNYWLHVSDGAP